MNFSTDPIRMETWSIDRLIPYARNPRKNDRAVDRMCGSIREFGFKIPCLIRSDGEVIDGHLRLKAARKLGITDIPVILCDEWTPAQVKAFRLLVKDGRVRGPNSRSGAGRGDGAPPADELGGLQMVGHGSKLGRKKAAVAALLTQRNFEEAARAAGIGKQTLN